MAFPLSILGQNTYIYEDTTHENAFRATNSRMQFMAHCPTLLHNNFHVTHVLSPISCASKSRHVAFFLCGIDVMRVFHFCPEVIRLI